MPNDAAARSAPADKVDELAGEHASLLIGDAAA